MKTKKITYSKILDVRNLTESTYVLRLEKSDFEFKAGQYLVLNVPGENKAREYSIYSPENTPYIDLLIKEVDEGEISKELKYLKVGTKVEITGPFGFFLLTYNEQIKRSEYKNSNISNAILEGRSAYHPPWRTKIRHRIAYL